MWNIKLAEIDVITLPQKSFVYHSKLTRFRQRYIEKVRGDPSPLFKYFSAHVKTFLEVFQYSTFRLYLSTIPTLIPA